MTNWLVTAQEQNEIPDAANADQPQTSSPMEIINNDQEASAMVEWFRQVNAANEFRSEAKNRFEQKLVSLGITDPSTLPPEIISLFQ